MPELIVDVDDWCTYWNDKADQAALAARQSRTPAFWEWWAEHRAWITRTRAQLKCLRALHLDVAERLHSEQPSAAAALDDDATDLTWPSPVPLEDVSWLPGLSESWEFDLYNKSVFTIWCPECMAAVLQWQFRELAQGSPLFAISWLELIFMFREVSISIPHPVSFGNGQKWLMDHSALATSHVSRTVASTIRYLRDLFSLFCRVFGLDIQFVRQLKLVELAIHFPLDGLPVLVSTTMLRSARRELRSWTSGRAVKVQNDLARPIGPR